MLNIYGEPMKKISKILYLITVTLIITLCPNFTSTQERSANHEVYFSPKGGALLAMMFELNKAQKEILIQAYSLTSVQIAEALKKAQKRGIRVEVLTDKKESKRKDSKVGYLYKAGIAVRIDSAHGKAHDKIIIIDGHTVITGSYNFTKAAEENNAENLLIIHDETLATRYIKNWNDHAKHSKLYEGIVKKEFP